VSRQARPDEVGHVEPDLYATIRGHGTVNFELARVRKLYDWYSINHAGKLGCGWCGGQRGARRAFSCQSPQFPTRAFSSSKPLNTTMSGWARRL